MDFLYGAHMIIEYHSDKSFQEERNFYSTYSHFPVLDIMLSFHI